MYHAKEKGRNNYQFYTASMNAVALQRLILESAPARRARARRARRCTTSRSSPRTGRVVAGVEALVRWPDPELGLVMPDAFIPIAEETGMIGALGEFVLRAELRGPGALEPSAACRRRRSA